MKFFINIKIATPEQFEKAKLDKYGDKIVITESNLNGEEIAIVYRIVEEYPNFLNTLPKWDVKVCQCPSDLEKHPLVRKIPFVPRIQFDIK